VGLGVGTVFGLMASGKKSNLDKVCVDKTCPASVQSDIDAMGTQTTASTVAFVVGGLGLAAGAALFVLTPSAPSHSSGVTFGPWVGVGSAGLRGAF
jgi:hypothetical protein